MKDMISVIMPAYNVEDTIEEAIQSILDQTYSNFELIICDDGSSDNTLKKIYSFADSRIKVLVNSNNLGNLVTTNRLLERAEGEIIALQDADDYSSKDRLKSQIDVITKKNIDLVSCHAGVVIDGKIISFIRNPEYPLNFMNSKKIPIIWGACLFKKKIYEAIGGFDNIFNRIGAADYNWLHRASVNFKFYNLQDSLYFYRQHSTSLTKSNKKIVIEKLYSEEIAYDIYQDFLKTGDYDKSRKIFDERKKYYIKLFSRDKSKILGVLYHNLLFKEINYFTYFKKVINLKTKISSRFFYLLKGFVICYLSFRFLEFLKKLR